MASNWTKVNVNAAAAAQAELVAATTNHKLVIHRVLLSAAATIQVILQSASTTLLQVELHAGGPLVVEDVHGLFETTKNEALNITPSGADQVSGAIWYTKERVEP